MRWELGGPGISSDCLLESQAASQLTSRAREPGMRAAAQEAGLLPVPAAPWSPQGLEVGDLVPQSSTQESQLSFC